MRLRCLTHLIYLLLLYLLSIFLQVAFAGEDSYEHGQHALQSGNYELAIKFFRLVVESDPDRVDAYTGLGYAESQLGRYEDAIESYQKALNLEIHAPQAHLGLGYIAYRQGRFDEAIRSYRAVINQGETGSAEAYHNLGRIYAERGEIDSAIACQKSALAIKSDFSDAHYHLAILYRRKREWESAIQGFQNAIRLQPLMTQAHYQLARCYTQTGDRDSANQSMAEFRRLSAEDAEVQRHLEAIFLAEDRDKVAHILVLGNLYLGQEKYPEAIKQFQRIVTLVPKSSEAFAGIGHAALEMENYSQAIASYEQAIQFGLKNARTYHNLGLAYMQLRNAEKALEDFQRAVALNPMLSQAHLMLGTLYAARKVFQSAEAHYKKVIQLDSDDAVAYHSLAYLYGQHNRSLENGVKLARKAAQLSPKSALYHSTLSWLLYKLGRYTEAEDAILRTIKINPNNPLYREGLEEIRTQIKTTR